MILTVTLNAALDITYPVPGLTPGATHRVTNPHRRAGGKGVNVARVLNAMSCPVVATGLLGGSTGAEVRHGLDAAGVAHDFTELDAETRRTVTVVDTATGVATAFNEAGPAITDREWQDFQSRFSELVQSARAVVCSGSLPPGLPIDAYAVLCRIATEHRSPVIVDAAGSALQAALPDRPALVKPNREELVETLGSDDPMGGATRLRDLGAAAVVVSLGADGLLAVTPNGSWRTRPPRALTGNPTGAGDAAVAALAAGIADGRPWPERLIAATALSAAAVHGTYAGDVDDAIRQEFTEQVTIEETHATDTHR